jgi:replicative DNA helicase
MGANLALHFAHVHKHAVHFASLEMTEKEVVQRMLASHARVNLTGLQTGNTDAKSWERIQTKYNEIADMPITIDDAPDQTVTHIRATARNVQRQREDLALIVVDYLQLMKIPGGSDNRAQALGEVSRGLKLLARETGACVVAMAQLNREAAKGQPPKSADLRESGSIEADADQVILLHQPDDEIPELTVIVDKNRHGPKGQCTLQVQGHYACLASVAWSPTKHLDSPRTNLHAIDGGRA